MVSTVRATPQGVVVRIYEAEGKAVNGATLTAASGIVSACETNLIEREARALEVSAEGVVRFDLTPFEVKTFLLVCKPLAEG